MLAKILESIKLKTYGIPVVKAKCNFIDSRFFRYGKSINSYETSKTGRYNLVIKHIVFDHFRFSYRIIQKKARRDFNSYVELLIDGKSYAIYEYRQNEWNDICIYNIDSNVPHDVELRLVSRNKNDAIGVDDIGYYLNESLTVPSTWQIN